MFRALCLALLMSAAGILLNAQPDSPFAAERSSYEKALASFDLNRAKDILHSLSRKGDPWACHTLGTAYDTSRKWVEAAVYYGCAERSKFADSADRRAAVDRKLKPGEMENVEKLTAELLAAQEQFSQAELSRPKDSPEMVQARRSIALALRKAAQLYSGNAATIESLRAAGYDRKYETKAMFDQKVKDHEDNVNGAAFQILQSNFSDAARIKTLLPAEWKALEMSHIRTLTRGR